MRGIVLGNCLKRREKQFANSQLDCDDLQEICNYAEEIDNQKLMKFCANVQVLILKESSVIEQGQGPFQSTRNR